MNHLHTHSEYSVLDGLGKIKDIVRRAKEIGSNAIAITDHASISMLPALFKECEIHGIKPIVGCEFYVVDTIEGDKKEKRNHLSVWAKDWQGVQSIMRQLTLANTQFYRRPRITIDQALNFDSCMVGTGCSFGVLAREDYKEVIKKFDSVYGDDLYLEIMPHRVIFGEEGIDDQKVVNDRAIELSRKIKANLLATNDAHYVNEDDATTHSILLCVQYGKKYSGKPEWDGKFHMRTMDEMAKAFNSLGYIELTDIVESIKETHSLADKVNIVKPEFKIQLPSIYESDDGAFAQIITDGWQRKVHDCGLDSIVYHKRLNHEINIISKMGFIKYFLIVHDVIFWSRSKGIMVGPARGSSAGSLVCYLMDIVQVDPIEHGLYFERFLNPDRVELPDIDVDFQDDRRQDVFDYIAEKYGKDKTSFINTFGRLTMNSAFRDVARTFGVEFFKINNLSKQINEDHKNEEKGITDSFQVVPELINFEKKQPELVKQARKLSGTIRQVGKHACGFIVSSEPLEDVCALERRKDNVMVTCWDKRESENFGLLKMDILGLTTLSILNRANSYIYKRTGKALDFESIPLTDEKTYKLFSAGKTTGVFQFENSGMKKLLRDLKASDFKTITATTALYRPGSLNSGETKRYTHIVQGHEYEQYACPELKPMLEDTKGILVYQEQVMRIFNELGGFTWAESDTMRKIIAKKGSKEDFEKHREHFVKGCVSNGIEERISSNLFDSMAEFSNYAFNLSHAVSYTIISYWCAYLKAHYPLEYISAYLSHCKEDSIADMVNEAGTMGICVKNPDINRSERYFVCDYEDNSIVAPLICIKGVGEKAVESIMSAREKGVFLSVEDMRERVVRRVVNIRVVKILERAGAFESFGIIESDQEQRTKNFNELLPIFTNLPSLELTGRVADTHGIIDLYKEVQACGLTKERTSIQPFVKSNIPSVMVIGGLVGKEINYLSGDSGKFFLDEMNRNGISEKYIYYTGVSKCIKSTEKSCINKGIEFLKREIELIKPRLIICYNSEAISMFESGGKMAKLNGQVKYNKTFDTYVMFSYSP